MRKSYEGQIKTLSLAGRNRAVKYSPTDFSPLYKDRPPMRLIDLARWPEEEWMNQKVHGKDVKKGIGEEVKAKLGEMMEFAPGKVPDNEKWEDLLGLEKSKSAPTTATQSSKGSGVLPNGAQRSSVKPNSSNVNNNSNRSEAARPRRANKKRRYDDGSFEGYGEGFVDDELEDLGADGGGGEYSSAGSSRRGSFHKKRKMG